MKELGEIVLQKGFFQKCTSIKGHLSLTRRTGGD